MNRILENKIVDKNTNIWAWRDIPRILDDSVVDFYPNGDKKLDIALDSVIELSGWTISIWVRKNDMDKDIDFAKHLTDIRLKFESFQKNKKTRYKLDKKFNFDEELEDIAVFIVRIGNNVSEIIKKNWN